MALYPIFMRQVALKLEKRGFKLLKIEPNKKKPQFNVYYFEDTIGLHNALVEIAARKNKQSFMQKDNSNGGIHNDTSKEIIQMPEGSDNKKDQR